MEVAFTYLLECADGSYYCGSTTDLHARLAQHETGNGGIYTQKRLPVRLVFAEPFDTEGAAIRRERQIKGWSRRKKEALIIQNKELLHQYAECQNETHYKHGR